MTKKQNDTREPILIRCFIPPLKKGLFMKMRNKKAGFGGTRLWTANDRPAPQRVTVRREEVLSQWGTQRPKPPNSPVICKLLGAFSAEDRLGQVRTALFDKADPTRLVRLLSTCAT